MSIKPPLNETFGIELEFVIRFEPPADADPNDNWKCSAPYVKPRPQNALVNALDEAGFAVSEYDDAWDPSKWTVADDGSINTYEQEEEYDAADTLAHEDIYKHACHSVELKSPAYLKCDESLNEVRRVVELINSKFDAVVNKSTGFHVHVGNGHIGYPLTTLQRFATLVSVFEERIEALHPDHRINNTWCMPVSTLLGTSRALERPAEIAWKAKTHDHLIRLMNDYRKDMAYNFQNLKPDRFQTIEFRQHEGTMDADRILAWIRFTTRLVSFAHYIPNDVYLKLIADHADDKQFTVTELMLVMNEPDLFAHYRGRLYSHERPLRSADTEETLDETRVGTVESYVPNDAGTCTWDNSEAQTGASW
ncbi:MAG: hypothetical protein M1835_003849 [Candelina submexicana]|nr:MAG: hypothetical protein M1835_003849 [Candelina submexicana]